MAGPAPRHLEQFLEMLAAERGAARLTIAAYRNDLMAAARFQKRGTLDAADSDDLRAYLVHLARQGLAPRSAARKLSALRQFFRFLVLERRRADDPT
ncbi:MAG: site-specific integrase, partial [Stellaceae bacterium]